MRDSRSPIVATHYHLKMLFLLHACLLSAIMLVQPVQSFTTGYMSRKMGFRQSVESKHADMRVSSSRWREGINFDETDDAELQLRKDALELLDCITSPKDEDDPAYDVVKDVRRDEVLFNNDHSALKVQLRERGLRQSGDKLEMIARLLLHIIDPTINYSQM